MIHSKKPTLNHELQSDLQRFTISILQRRYEQNMTQAQLAKAIGASRATLARLESGKGNPTLQTLLKIAEALDVRLVLE